MQPPPPQYIAPQRPAAGPKSRTPEGEKSYITTVVLSFLLGMFGADRFYLGKTGTALAKLLTLGGCGYWWLIDLIITLCGGQRDVRGFRLAGYDQYKKKVWVVIGAVYGGLFAIGLISRTLATAFGGSNTAVSGWLALAVIAAGGAGFVIWRRRRGSSAKPAGEKRNADPTPTAIRTPLAKLSELRPLYIAHAAAGNKVAIAVIRLTESLQSNMPELFARLASRSDKAQRARAEVEYVEKLGKLAAALDRDYLLDILSHPRFWETPEVRAHDVQHALEAVDAQLLENIRQVNAHHGLVFQVSIDGLIGPRKAMEDWQREFDETSGTE